MVLRRHARGFPMDNRSLAASALVFAIAVAAGAEVATAQTDDGDVRHFTMELNGDPLTLYVRDIPCVIKVGSILRSARGQFCVER